MRLRDSSREQVNVVRLLVDLAQDVPALLVHLLGPVRPVDEVAADAADAGHSARAVVAAQTVVATALDVDGNQVASGLRNYNCKYDKLIVMP